MVDSSDDERDGTVKRSSVYFKLNDKVAKSLYVEWRAKATGYIKSKGWGVVFDDPDKAIPTKAEATAADATDEVKALYSGNESGLQYLLTCCSGLPFRIVNQINCA